MSWLSSRRNAYFRNRDFVEKAWKRNDQSVMFSIYSKIDRSLFNGTCMIDDLRYIHEPNDNEDPAVANAMSYVKTYEEAEAVGTSLGPLDPATLGNYHFVIYGMIDLMNLMYTRTYTNLDQYPLPVGVLEFINRSSCSTMSACTRICSDWDAIPAR